MASSNGKDGISKATGEKFPAADIHGELNPGQNNEVNVDPVSSEITTSLEMTKQVETVEKNEEAMQKLKSAVIISAVVVAVAGAALAVTKKLREK